jgi:peptidyl-prolyl cis-trans isomerase A (cyclophilin A)
MRSVRQIVIGSCLATAMLAAAGFTLAAANKEKLMAPATLAEKAPDAFNVKFETSKGDFVVEVNRDWAPNGADRFYNLVRNGYYDDCRFFRIVPNFVVQFGINGDPSLNAVWQKANIQDDPVKKSNTAGYLTFATAGKNTRTTQLFINLRDNTGLDGQGFSPFARVSSGMDVVNKLYAGYGEGAPRGAGPDQGRIQSEGNSYLMKDFGQLDYIKKATVMTAADEKKADAPKPK